MRREGPLQMLIVEDNPADVRLLEESLGELPIPWRLHVATDGEAATRRVHELDSIGDGPDLILLDLNLPNKSREVLKSLNTTPPCIESP
jgi:two-component system, chemotaxis family, response regulator Rcp1